MKDRKFYLPAITCSLALLASQAQAANFDHWDDVATLENADYEYAEHIALLGSYDDGSQFIIARTVWKAGNPNDMPAGTRIGPDIIIDGNAVWGHGGTTVLDTDVVAVWGHGGTTVIDIDISSIPIQGINLIGPMDLQTPPRLIGLLDNGNIVDLQGVWGNGGTTLIEDIDDWHPGTADAWPAKWKGRVSETGLNFDADTCGKPVAISETTVHLKVVDAELGTGIGAGLVPAFAVGTDKGCVGMLGFKNPLTYFDVPIIAFEDPGVTFDVPIIAFDVPIIAFDVPIIAMAPVFRESSGGQPRGYGVAISAGTKLTTLDTGKWIWSSDTQVTKVISPDTFTIRLVGAEIAPTADEAFISTPSIRYSESNYVSLPPPTAEFLGTPIVVADGSSDIRVAVMPGDLVTFDLNPLDTLSMSQPIGRIALGSLLTISADGQDVTFVSDFDPMDVPGSGEVTEFELGGVQSISFGPRTLSLGAKGKKVTAVIEASGADAANIDPASILLSVGGLGTARTLAPIRTNLVDRDHDGNLELVAKFDRADLAELLAQLYPEHQQAGLLLSWETSDDSCGSDKCPGSYPLVVRIIE